MLQFTLTDFRATSDGIECDLIESVDGDMLILVTGYLNE